MGTINSFDFRVTAPNDRVGRVLCCVPIDLACGRKLSPHGETAYSQVPFRSLSCSFLAAATGANPFADSSGRGPCNFHMTIGLRVSEEEEEIQGVDLSQHGEEGYYWEASA